MGRVILDGLVNLSVYTANDHLQYERDMKMTKKQRENKNKEQTPVLIIEKTRNVWLGKDLGSQCRYG